MNEFSKDETLKAKCIAILLLILHHMYFRVETVSSNINLSILRPYMISSIATDARFCVWIFVFLSAYGMTASYYKLKGNSKQFFWHRVVSLQGFCLPILLVYYILAIGFRKTGAVFSKPYYVIFNILGLSDMLGMPSLGDGYWYINFTILLILFMPLFISACEKCGYSIIPVTIVLFKYVNSGIHSNSGGNYIAYLLAVFVGILFYQKNLWNKIANISIRTKIILFIPICACIVLLPHLRNKIANDVWSIKQLLSTIPAILVCFLHSCTAGERYWSSRWLF